MPIPDSTRATATGQNWFATTHWSVVLAANQTAPANAREAMEKLCGTYWYPLHAYVRRQGYGPHDAQDLTQGFFARVLGKNYLAQVDRQKGKFRSFLLASLRHFLSDERDRANALKRGGDQTFISLDGTSAKERFGLEPVDETNPERTFERQWALTVLEKARDRLREEYVAAGKAAYFDEIKTFITGQTNTLTYAEVAARLGTTESAIKSAVPRLRRRYQELLREEIAHTVTSPAEVDDEIRYLIAVISG